MNDLIVRNDAKLSISFSDDAEIAKYVALESSALIGVVRNPGDQAIAVEAQRMIRTLLKQVEDARVEVKAPVLEYCRTIDARAKEFVEELKVEETRLAKVVGDYQTEQIIIARRLEAERQAEVRRIEEEERQALQKAEEERQAELAKARESEKAELLKQQEAARLAEEARQAELTKQKLEALPPAPTPAKARGQTVREAWLFEVTDIWLLARTNPGLVRIEANKQEINEVIARGVREVKGLRIYQETKSSVRLREQKAIDV